MRWEMLNCVKQGSKWIVLFSGWYWRLTHEKKKGAARQYNQLSSEMASSDHFNWPLQLLHFKWTLLKLNEDPPKPFSINIVDQKPCLSTYWFSFCKERCNEFTWVTWLPMVGETLNYIVSFFFLIQVPEMQLTGTEILNRKLLHACSITTRSGEQPKPEIHFNFVC